MYVKSFPDLTEVKKKRIDYVDLTLFFKFPLEQRIDFKI
jgi:hypothetical protein